MSNLVDELDRRRMWRWRNVKCPECEPDPEITKIDAFEDTLDEFPAIVERIRALISRIDPLSHYKAFENINFILDAIGKMDYPGSPAVDVLWRHGQIDEQRRKKTKGYVDCLSAWLSASTLDEARKAQPENSELLEFVYQALGRIDDSKKWLAMSLQKTLKEHAYTPWDHINESDDEIFIRGVYQSILHRQPSPDDLQFRLEELQNGKKREAFYQEILDAEEHRMSHLFQLAEFVKQKSTS